jgi:hypothetical protein
VYWKQAAGSGDLGDGSYGKYEQYCLGVVVDDDDDY